MDPIKDKSSPSKRWYLRAQVLLLGNLLAVLTHPAAAQDALRGRQWYETQCGSCHYERVHQRERSRSAVQTLATLRAEVARWALQTKAPMTAQDIDDIVEYLNRSHYRMDK
jgi:mono/diheme cytochrome c family protein